MYGKAMLRRRVNVNGVVTTLERQPSLWNRLIITIMYVVCGSNAIAIAQPAVQPPPQGATAGVAEQQPYTNQYQGVYYTSDLKEVFRLRHIEGEGQGGVDAYTNFGFTKLVWVDRGILLWDIGARVTNDAEPGFTTGIHRRFVTGGDLMLGGGLFYDLHEEFHQGSVAFEVFSPNWAFRTNGYFVIGNDVDGDSEYEATGATNVFFAGNSLFADNLLLEEEYQVAMSGADIELARSIGFPSAEVFIGGYFYGGEIGDDAIGAKGGVRGFLAPDLSATVSVSGDDLFGANIYGGLTWFLGAKGGLSRPNVARRLLIPVERNEQVVVNEVERTSAVAGPIVLTSADDDEIEFAHVDAGAAGANEGTFEDPFNALPDTQEADIVYVWADGVFVGQSYTLAEDQRLLGEGSGNLHVVDTDELGEIILPAGNGGANRPTIQGAPGNAITLAAQDNEVSNFNIVGAAANGIYGLGVTDFDINRNVVTGSIAGRGIFLELVSGVVDEEPIARGEINDNVVTGSQLSNIEMSLDSDFVGEISGNTANGSVTLEGIVIHGPFVFDGAVSDNIADGNFTDGIVIEVDEFFGEIEDNVATNNTNTGLAMTFGAFDGDIEGNTASNNGDVGIALHIDGDNFSDIEITFNTMQSNGAEGMYLLFSGRGTSRVDVFGNDFDGNNGGADREFFAENEDAPGNRPEVFIELDGNTSTNALGAGPPFNYEFDNNDLFADGEMFLELGANVGTVENDEDVEPAEFPW
jgi:parallel beta-helix repeat protein